MEKDGRLRALCLPGSGCRGAFQLATIKALWENGERFDLVAGASSGSITGAIWVAGLASDGPDMFRTMASTPIVSSRYLRTDASPFGMSTIVREALLRFVPEERIAGAETELLVSTTRASRLVGGFLKKSARSAKAMLSRRPLVPSAVSASAAFEVFASPSPMHSLATEANALTVHSNQSRRDMHDVIVASCAIPGLYARLPVLDGEVHVDGGASDNTLLSVLVARGATDITVVSPYPEGAVSPTLFERERAPRVPSAIRLRLLWPETPLRLRHFDFDPGRLEEALMTPYVERVLEPIALESIVREGAA